MQNAMKLSENI